MSADDTRVHHMLSAADALIGDLCEEADLCRNEGADDIAALLDRAVECIDGLRALAKAPSDTPTVEIP